MEKVVQQNKESDGMIFFGICIASLCAWPGLIYITNILGVDNPNYIEVLSLTLIFTGITGRKS